MKAKNVTYLKLYVVRNDERVFIYNYDKEDAEELFKMLVRLERKMANYRIKVCQAVMEDSKEGGE